LDCVSQLRGQFPSNFEFSEIYLVRVWDSLCTGAFRTFAFNTVHDNQYAIVGNGAQHGSNSLIRFHTSLYAFFSSVWDWPIQFSDAQIALNFDPLHAAKNKSLADKTNTNDCIQPVNGNKSAKLEPSVKIYDIKLWSLCYLRWVAPVTVVGGGLASEYLTQCLLVEEIQSLQGKIASCESSLSGRGSNAERRRSMLVFGSRAVVADQVDGKNENHSRWNSSLSESLPQVTSSFPFAEFKQNAGVHCVSVDSYGEECVSFCYDYDVNDDESVRVESLLNESFVVVDSSSCSHFDVENPPSEEKGNGV